MNLSMSDLIDHQITLMGDLELPEIDVLDCMVRYSKVFGTPEQLIRVKEYRSSRYFEIYGFTWENDFGN